MPFIFSLIYFIEKSFNFIFQTVSPYIVPNNFQNKIHSTKILNNCRLVLIIHNSMKHKTLR